MIGKHHVKFWSPTFSWDAHYLVP